ncbi:TBKB1 protein, partial [Oceanites oceanicus]|nr:TBKB1 protein [Oceanites oceanicus]
MDSMFEDDISILTQEALGPDEDWLDSPNTDLSGEMCSASHFALITAKEREEQLEEMIQAYEKLCVEKADLETELGEMRALVETHLSRIRSLEQQLRQRDGGTFPGLGTPLPGQDVPFLTLHPNPSLTHVLERAGGWQSRGLEAAGRLEAELEAARQETQRAQHREEHLKAECERLQAELKHLQDTREQDQSERDMAWVKKVGDDQ